MNDAQAAINDIRQCVDDAQAIASQTEHWSGTEHRLHHAFISLAGDAAVGFLAYAIWRSRSQLLSSLRMKPSIEYDEPTGARHTQT
jgi:DNA-binding GntR family transcriptional regulator